MMFIKIIQRWHISFRFKSSKTRSTQSKRNHQSRDKGDEALIKTPLLFLHFVTTFRDIE